MDNPLLEIDALPAFDRIAAAHARPALERVLADNRARLAELTAQPTPTFASLVVPVEELSYRLSRVWSPIGHLNAVANSDAMREAYNDCVPLLTAYSSELGQNEALYAAYAHVQRTEGAQPRSRAAQAARERAARFSSRRRRPAARSQSALPRGGAAARAACDQVLRERARCRARLHAARHRRVRARRPAGERGRSRGRRARARRTQRLAVQARSADLHDGHDQRRERAVAARHLRGLGHARLRARTERRPLRQQPDHRRDPAAAARARAAPGLCELRRLRAGHAHGEERQAGARFPGRSGAALPPGGAPRVRRARGVRGTQARGLGPRLLQRAAAGEPLQGVAGGAAPLFSAAESAVRAVRGHRAAVRHHGARAARA